MAVVPKLAVLPDNPLLPLSINSTDWNALLNHRPGVNVLDYGADNTGVSDSTAAFQAAIAAIPTTGGALDIPPGKYAINLTVDRPKITLRGCGIGRPTNTPLAAGLVPYNQTQPVLTLSSDTQLNEGICLQDLEINGLGTGQYGIKMLGGTYSCTFDNISIQNFTKKELWIRSGTSKPCAYLFFNKLLIQSGNFASHEHAVLIEVPSDLQYAAAIFFSGVRLSGVAFGHIYEQSGCSGIAWTNSWFQIQGSAHGVLLSKPGSVTPRLYGNALFLDSDNGSDILLEVTFGSGAADVTGNYVYGFVGIDGKIDLNGSLRVNVSTFHLSDLSFGVEFKNTGKLFFVDPTDQNNQGMWLSGATATGRLTMGSTNHAQFQPGNGIARIISGLASSEFDIVVNAGTHAFRGNGAALEIEPAAGGSIWLKSSNLVMGNPSLTLTVDQTSGQWRFQGAPTTTNNAGFKQFAQDGVTVLGVASYNSSNNLFIGNGSTGTFTSILSPGSVYLAPSAATANESATGHFRPQIDNSQNLGTAGQRWKEVFAINGTINTSDERDKQDVAPISDAVLDAWAEVQFVEYRWKASVAEKGDAARRHFGVLSQQIRDAFAKHGLDAARYGLFCYDEWPESKTLAGIDEREEAYDAEVIEVRQEEREVEEYYQDDVEVLKGMEIVKVRVVLSRMVRKLVPVNVPVTKRLTRIVQVERHETRQAGNRFGVRYEQCLVLEAALMRRDRERLWAAMPKAEK